MSESAETTRVTITWSKETDRTVQSLVSRHACFLTTPAYRTPSLAGAGFREKGDRGRKWRKGRRISESG